MISRGTMALMVLLLSSSLAAGLWYSGRFDGVFGDATASHDGYRTLNWPDLVPAGAEAEARGVLEALGAEVARLEDGTLEADVLLEKINEANANVPLKQSLHGQKVMIAGHVVPLDWSPDTIQHFLLVPYQGACIHLPPPPANQLIYAELASPVAAEETWFPVWISGTLQVERFDSELGTAGYRMAVEQLSPWQP